MVISTNCTCQKVPDHSLEQDINITKVDWVGDGKAMRCSTEHTESWHIKCGYSPTEGASSPVTFIIALVVCAIIICVLSLVLHRTKREKLRLQQELEEFEEF